MSWFITIYAVIIAVNLALVGWVVWKYFEVKRNQTYYIKTHMGRYVSPVDKHRKRGDI